MAFVQVAKDVDVKEGKMKIVSVLGQEIVVARVNGALHAFQNTCTHKGGPLGEGELSGTVVTCPWHAVEFDIATGKVVKVPFGPGHGTGPIRTFPVKAENGAIWVDGF